MSIIVDLIILAIIALCVFLGYKRGLVKCIIKILSFIIAIVLTIILYKPISNVIIENTEADENIKQSVINAIGSEIQEDGKVKEDSDLPQTLIDYINESVSNTVQETKNSMVEVVAQKIAEISINIGVAISIFITVKIILLIVSALSKILTDLPGIKQFDKAGGIIYGILKSGLIIFIILSIISMIGPMISETGIISAINKSFIGSILYNNNILLNILF